ncbi:hypothetical protein Tco_0221871 [Tanacetum coccineum]
MGATLKIDSLGAICSRKQQTNYSGSKTLRKPVLPNSFRRHPRGGLELTQVEELAKVINPVVLTQSPDSWSWTLNNSGGYTVAVSVKKQIDSRLLPKVDLQD